MDSLSTYRVANAVKALLAYSEPVLAHGYLAVLINSTFLGTSPTLLLLKSAKTTFSRRNIGEI